LLVLFVIDLLFSLFLKYLNYSGDDSPELKEQILRYFSQEDIDIGIKYDREGFAVSLISWGFSKLFIFLLVFTKFSESLEQLSDFFAKGKEIAKIFYFISIIYLIYFLMNLPFSFYFGYIIEHEYGFSKMTIGFWLWTKLKTFVISFVGINMAVQAICFAIKKFPFNWIFIIPVGSLIFGMLFTLAYPYTILPLFYDVEPIQEGSLKTKIQNLSEKSGINLSEISIIKESEYSSHTNAFFTGFGSEKKIFLYDTLIEKNTEEEIVSVLGHEIGHWKYNHTLFGVLEGFIEMLLQFLVVYYLLLLIQKEGKIFLKELHSPAVIPIILFLTGLMGTLTTPISSSISRSMETQADKVALELTNDPDSFISSEVKLAKDNKSRLDVHPFVEFYYLSHPKTMDRILLGEEFKKQKGK
jgi:STE24 endopeptidase